MSSIIPVVVSSAGEAEYGGVFMNAQSGEWLRTVSAAIGYPQSATQIMCDNECAVGLATNKVKVKRTKSIHWVRDRVRQGHFRFIGVKGSTTWQTFSQSLSLYTFINLFSHY